MPTRSSHSDARTFAAVAVASPVTTSVVGTYISPIGAMRASTK
jgi:hypothetical protein